MSYDASELYELSKDLGTVPKVAGHMARVAVRKTAKDVQKDAKLIAFAKGVHETGNLIDHIETSDLRTVGTSGTLEAEVVATAEYSYWNEVGTSRMPPRPYMGPALDKNTPAFEEAMAQIMARAVSGG